MTKHWAEISAGFKLSKAMRAFLSSSTGAFLEKAKLLFKLSGLQERLGNLCKFRYKLPVETSQPQEAHPVRSSGWANS
jgi:hypothetical protein